MTDYCPVSALLISTPLRTGDATGRPLVRQDSTATTGLLCSYEIRPVPSCFGLFCANSFPEVRQQY